MNINRATLENCHTYTGTIVVIDVIRAFTTAAVAFDRGVSEINLVGEVSEALLLRDEILDSRVMGEVGGIKVPEFDYGNSPADLAEADLKKVKMIQRTTAGTQGVVRSKNADYLIAGSFINAKATARYLLSKNFKDITFVITGNHSGADGAEDFAYADYMEEVLKGNDPSPKPFILAVQNSTWGKCFGNPSRPEFPAADMDFILEFNKFNFVMPISRENGRHKMTKVDV